jgi:hypothetical protein
MEKVEVVVMSHLPITTPSVSAPTLRFVHTRQAASGQSGGADQNEIFRRHS